MAKLEGERLGFSVQEFARRVGVSVNTAYAAVRSKQIPAVRIGNRWIIPAKALETFLEGKGGPDAA